MKTIGCLIALTVLLAGCGPRREKGKPNADASSAQPIRLTPGTGKELTIRGRFNPESSPYLDIDWYALHIHALHGTPYQADIRVTPSRKPQDVSFALFDEKKRLIKHVDDYGVSPHPETVSSLAVRGNQQYYVKVFVRSEKPTTSDFRYSLYLSVRPRNRLVEQEPNDTRRQATPLTAGKVYNGHISPRFHHKDGRRLLDRDWYRLETAVSPSPSLPRHSQSPGRNRQPLLSAEVSGVPGADLQLQLYSHDGDLLKTVNTKGQDRGESLPPYLLREDGPYYLSVHCREGRANPAVSYKIQYRLSRPQENEEIEPNNTIENATVLPDDRMMFAAFSARDDHDYYRLDLASPSRLTLRMSPLPHFRARLRFFTEKDADPFHTSDSDQQGKIKPPPVYLGPGTYYLRLTPLSTPQPSRSYQLLRRAEPIKNGEQEFNNSAPFADTITVGSVKHGTIAPSGDIDFFSIKTAADTEVKFHIEGGPQLMARVSDSSGIETAAALSPRGAHINAGGGPLTLRISAPQSVTSILPYRVSTSLLTRTVQDDKTE